MGLRLGVAGPLCPLGQVPNRERRTATVAGRLTTNKDKRRGHGSWPGGAVGSATRCSQWESTGRALGVARPSPWPSGSLQADVPVGEYEVCLSKGGYGSKRVRARLGLARPVSFRLLSDRLLGYAWPKWCRGGDRVEFRVHAVEPYKLGLYRYG